MGMPRRCGRGEPGGAFLAAAKVWVAERVEAWPRREYCTTTATRSTRVRSAARLRSDNGYYRTTAGGRRASTITECSPHAGLLKRRFGCVFRAQISEVAVQRDLEKR